MLISLKHIVIDNSKHHILGCFRHATIASDPNINKWTIFTTTGYNECHKKCGQDDSCVAFIWSRQTQTCKLYESLGNAYVIEDLLSVMGPRDCSKIQEIWPESRNLITSTEKSSTER